MGLHQWVSGSVPDVVFAFHDDTIHEAPPRLINENQAPPPWLDHTFLDRLDELNRQPSHTRRGTRTERTTSGLRSDAIDSFAHEIRTPLATLHATLELLSDDTTFERAELSEMVNRLQRGVSWITELIDGLADRADTTGSPDDLMPLREGPTDVCGWVDGAIALVQPIARQREQSISLVCTHPLPAVHGDPLRLGQVVVNLLTNACRYGAWADTIVVAVNADTRWVTIRVTDHGIGISPEDQAQIFECRVRGTKARQQHQGGKGLGLAIARSIVKQHHGTIEVESAADQGTTFTVRLPVMPTIRPLVLRRVRIKESEVTR